MANKEKIVDKKSFESEDFFVKWTQRYLQRRKRKKYIQKQRQKRKNFVEDWGGALLWAACVVLLINQYFFQAYKIPSSSMVDSLNIGDMLFVNKMVYGPELIPGAAKIPSFVEPKRGEIIIFESPEYQSKGAAFDLVSRMIYMLTFSLVNIDKDNSGNEAVHFLVKRAIGTEGDFVSFDENRLYITPTVADKKMREKVLFSELNCENNTQYRNRGKKGNFLYDSYHNNSYPLSYEYFTSNPQQYSVPFNTVYHGGSSIKHNPRFLAMRDHYGFFIEKGYMLPLGDNRNNSHDGRSWGPVHKSKILGRVAIRYWPLIAAGVPK